jgi:hypothetical protein
LTNFQKFYNLAAYEEKQKVNHDKAKVKSQKEELSTIRDEDRVRSERRHEKERKEEEAEHKRVQA